MGSKSRLRECSSLHTSPDERRLVQKIDFFILTFCCLSYFFNYLDRMNLANAYVSGMKEELGFKGDQLNQINTVFTVGYIIGQIPSNLSLHYIRPRYFFPAMMVIWASLTMITAATHSPRSIMAIRFFQGIAESTTFVGTHYILGSWYTPRELGKRSGIFTASGLAGTMVGGFMQTGIHSALDGHSGLSGWRWLFIIDGLITLPIALYGFLLFPDTPSTTTAFYLTPPERALAVARMSVTSAPHPKPKVFPWSFARAVLASWEWWGFVTLWIIAAETESFSSNTLLSLYLKSSPTRKYSVSELNDYPTGVPAVGIVSTLFWATLTDFLGGRRDLVGYFIGVTGIATSAMILAARGGGREGMVFAAYYWAGAVYACQAVFFAWANDAMRRREPVFRGVVLAGMNLGSNAVNAWWSILFYGASMAPWFERGMYAMIATSAALVFWTGGLTYVAARNEKRMEVLGQDGAGSSREGVESPKGGERV
ncbi:major facilitator superfamily domain-containing protein [Lasiosphaeria hispida]|uniref:Major facilitator superfamily domain-containing protein n=1 Tax=Lasiosphaeria hispida TaxID=260671 RepID=A0AAJ0MEW6_9PEZI|nr:major facilitator superfamily domain-containing protein [Lasiosphaeria hispida]